MGFNIKMCIIFMLSLFILSGYEVGAHVGHGKEQEGHAKSGPMTFFTQEELKLGKIFPDQALITSPSDSAKFLPRKRANLIPFALSELSSIIQFFGFPQSSFEAKSVEDALFRCESSPAKGETKACATSLESLLDFVNQTFKSTSGFKALTSKQVNPGNTKVSNRFYTIVEEPRQVPTTDAISCHLMAYPYAVYYCHHMNKAETAIKVFHVSLRGENGEFIEAVSVCHLDTSEWEPEHASFRVFGLKHGSPVCHFFPSCDLVWVPVTSTVDSQV